MGTPGTRRGLAVGQPRALRSAAGPTASPVTCCGFSPSDSGKWWGMWDASYTVPWGAFRADVACCLGHCNVGSGLSLALQNQGPQPVLAQRFARGSRGERFWSLSVAASVCKESQNVAWRWAKSSAGGGCYTCKEANRHLYAKSYSFHGALTALGTKW